MNPIDLEKSYLLLIKQIEVLIDASLPTVSNLSNITAAIKQTFENISWVGFYIKKDSHLYLGPFQGKVACTKIKIGDGVCGKSFEDAETIIVPNVHKFPGHIACDVETNSEIVIPIFNNEKTVGVLDLDSREFESFNEIDKIWLERIGKIVSTKLNLEKLF
ncbi:MAG: GAF domain-containing protein [Ignavibacteriae bacterium]|nr:GAF domain-containing protein [Ignavibacteriota bacterium]